MDELEKKEELEPVVEEIEEVVEEPKEESTEEVVEEPKEEPAEEATEEPAKETETGERPVEKTVEKGGSNVIGIIVGAALFIAFLAVVWMTPVGKVVKDTGVLYAKDNDLYYYDMKNEPCLLQEDISAGGGYNYFYSAWGAGISQDNEELYYTANVQAEGTYDLYYKNLKADDAAELVDSGVIDHKVSKNGEVVAYLAMKGDSLELRYFDGKEKRVAEEGMKLEEDVYSLSADGKHLAYKDAYDMLCATRTDLADPATKLTDDCPLYALAEDTLYFVSKADGMHNIYSYDFKNEPVLVAENAQYMELMPNGRDLLYGVKPTEIIPYSELLEDDMAEIDAAMKEDDPNYEQKLMRDELREAMKSGKGLEPLLQEYYILSNGKARLVADHVVSAIAVADSEKNFITGYKAKPFQPLYLSVIGGGLEMVDMIYYMSINYGGMQPFLADSFGNVEVLNGSEGFDVQLNTVQVSADGSEAAYLAQDANGGNVLMQMELGQDETKEYTAIQENVKEFAFVGDHDLFYYYDYANGAGKLGKAGEGDNSIDAASGVQFAKDAGRVYYLLLDQKTGNGKMEWWDGETRETIDGGVFAFQYKGNGKAALVYGYDPAQLTGDLGYYDGKGVTKLDEDITAIFIN